VNNVLEEISRAGGRISPAEIEAALRPVLSLARCQTQERMRILTGEEQLELPGICTIPYHLFEVDYNSEQQELGDMILSLEIDGKESNSFQGG
jgi:hypothetical protein